MKNIIFLVMSTLPNKSTTAAIAHTYQYGDMVYKGISQLEPGTKYYLQTLAANQQKIDKIVIIASKETNKPNDAYGSLSALEVYQNSIMDFIKGISFESRDYGFICEQRGNSSETLMETYFSGTNLYQNISMEDLFQTVYILGQDDQYIFEIISALTPAEGDTVNLYLDMQGGSRNDLMTMNAVIELLKDQQVYVKSRIAIDFNNQKSVHSIRHVEQNYRIYDLLTAYQVFRQYGWGDNLVAYFTNENNSEVSEQDKAIVQNIQNISNAIKLCDVDTFDASLRELSRNIVIRKELDTTSHMNFIIGEIQKDFGELLNEEKRFRYVRQIEWCLRKNFYQQAVTILESKMPTEYVNCGIKYYCRKTDDREQMLGNFEFIYENIIQIKHTMKDLNHYFICDYSRDKDKYRKGKISNDEMATERYRELCKAQGQKDLIPSYYGLNDKQNKKAIKNNIESYKGIKNIRNTFNHAKSLDHAPDGFFERMRRKNKEDANFIEIFYTDSEIRNTINSYLAEFKHLADLVSERAREEGTEIDSVDLS